MDDKDIQISSRARVTEYRLALADSDSWAVNVRWRGDDRWSVESAGLCLGADGEWCDPRGGRYIDDPAEREAWLASHRFTLDEAMRRAEKALRAVQLHMATLRVVSDG